VGRVGRNARARTEEWDDDGGNIATAPLNRLKQVKLKQRPLRIWLHNSFV